MGISTNAYLPTLIVMFSLSLFFSSCGEQSSSNSTLDASADQDVFEDIDSDGIPDVDLDSDGVNDIDTNQNGIPDKAEDGTIGTTPSDGPVGVGTSKWRTGPDPQTGRFVFIDPNGERRVLKGVSMTGMESGEPGTPAGGGYWMYHSGDPRLIVENVVEAMDEKWYTGVIRIPICGSAWDADYQVHSGDWGGGFSMSYRDWVDIAVQRARSLGRVAIIDLHLWQIAPFSSSGKGPDRGEQYEGRIDGCIGHQKFDNKDTCSADQDWVNDGTQWTCAVANAEGVTLQNAHHNRNHIANMWQAIAEKYKNDSGVFFELFNEPYEHIDNGDQFGSEEIANKAFPREDDYDWEMWTEIMDLWIEAIRSKAKSNNVILVNGLMWGYTFHGPIDNPDTYLPWIKDGHKNIAYGFHPYQHGACCGKVGVDVDESETDPYYATYCRYFRDGTESNPSPSNEMLPSNKTCGHIGYERTRAMGMPPCEWKAHAYNPNGTPGLCVGQPDVCEPLSADECKAIDRSSPEAGGWSRYVLPMNQFGPLIATEFGSFDCSSPFVKTLMDYANEFDISYTAWALWPQNNGGTLELGMCSYPGITEPFPDENPYGEPDFKACEDSNVCKEAMAKPMRFSGQVVWNDLKQSAGERFTQ